ncbi:MAG: acyl-ACP--UDP-N-acetylglucosamine O-acyltransferase [Burkholderiales bacterium]|nr:acyl-ACP--UDP-N-acetylglucosamine O-acyltransferase [Burkholderiales bacterium]
MARIHSTAVVDPQAQLGSDVSVGPYTVIGPHVRIDEGTTVGPHCVIEGHTTIGRDNRIYQFASLGGNPQDKKYDNEPTQLIIGDRNTIREFTTFNVGTTQDEGITRLGNDNWMMAYVHLAHDCQVGNHTIFANNAHLAGHVHVGDWAILGGFTCVHQFVKIGAHAMTSMATALGQDLPPYVMAQGNMAEARGLNLEGLRRRGYSAERLKAVKEMHRALYRLDLTLEAAKMRISSLVHTYPEAAADVALMTGFLEQSTRGIVR